MPTIAAPIGHAHKTLLADRRVDHPVGAELVHQVAGHAEEAAVVTHVFAHDKTLGSRRISSFIASLIA
jgi:hypothetical protein